MIEPHLFIFAFQNDIYKYTQHRATGGSWSINTTAEHVSGAERGASEERSVQNIVGARSGFLSKGWSDRSVSLRFRSDTAHTTSLGHAQIHPEFTCAFNN